VQLRFNRSASARRSVGDPGWLVRRWSVLAALLVCAIAGSAAVAVAAKVTPPVNLLQVLAKPLAKAERGKVPVLVPSRLSAGFPPSQLYAGGGLSGGGYDIQLGAAPHCEDATACFVAEFSAAKGVLGFKDTVALSKGITGSFHPISCGASCGPATIEWVESGFLYTVQFGAGEKQLVVLADSAIEAGPR
jgi:hypothetical protein